MKAPQFESSGSLRKAVSSFLDDHGLFIGWRAQSLDPAWWQEALMNIF